MGTRSHRRADARCDAPQEVEVGVRGQRPVRLPASRRQAPRGTGAERTGHLGADSPAQEDWQIAAGDRRPVEPAEDPDPARLTVAARIRGPAPEGGVILNCPPDHPEPHNRTGPARSRRTPCTPTPPRTSSMGPSTTPARQARPARRPAHWFCAMAPAARHSAMSPPTISGLTWTPTSNRSGAGAFQTVGGLFENMAKYAEDFTVATWDKNGGSCSVTADTTTAPDGNTTADTITVVTATPIIQAAHEHSRPRARTNCELTQGLFVPLLFESQSGTLACNGAVFSDCSGRIVGKQEVIETRLHGLVTGSRPGSGQLPVCPSLVNTTWK